MSDEPLWVCWIPTGTRQDDEGAYVGPEWKARKKAAGWLKADPEHVLSVMLAPLPEHGVVTAELDEIGLKCSDDLEFTTNVPEAV